MNQQNLLILTAVRAAPPSRVTGHVDQLHNFDAKDMDLICISESHMLLKFSKSEFTPNEQVEMQVLAIGVLVMKGAGQDVCNAVRPKTRLVQVG